MCFMSENTFNPELDQNLRLKPKTMLGAVKQESLVKRLKMKSSTYVSRSGPKYFDVKPTEESIQ